MFDVLDQPGAVCGHVFECACKCVCVVQWWIRTLLSLHTRAPTASRGLPVHIWVPRRESPREPPRGDPPAWPNMDEDAFGFQRNTRTFRTAAAARVARTGRGGVYKRRGGRRPSSRQLEPGAGPASSLTAGDEQQVKGAGLFLLGGFCLDEYPDASWCVDMLSEILIYMKGKTNRR